MKVLITGGYGFIGSHVADRFHKEGYEVFIIDDLSTGREDNVQFKHKGYHLSIEDAKCEEIFRAYRFDVVVNLAAQVSVKKSLVDPQLDTETNILGFVNMLDLSAKHGVKRFIYASSAAVYGIDQDPPYSEDSICNPISPYGLSKLSNEMYSEKWNQLYDLSTIGFRFSNVYGPRQNNKGEGGVVSIFVNSLLRNESLTIYGDGKQTRDFIYVEDIVDGIYRSVNSTAVGIYNLSANEATSVNELVEKLSEFNQDIEVKYEGKRLGDIAHSVLDNTKVMRELDWAPLYTLQQGLERTVIYFSNHQAKAEIASTATTNAASGFSLQHYLKKLLPTFENLLAFALTAWLTLNVVHSSYGVIDVKIFYITIIGILYGNKQAVLSVALSIGLYSYQKMADGRDFISLAYDTDFFFQIAIYIFIGLVVGYSIERKNARIQQQEQKIAEVSERYEFLDNVYNEVREVKDELQLRILNSGDSYGKIYHATKELESLEPELVFNSAVNVVKSILRVNKVTIYTVNKHQSYLRLLASSGYGQDQLAKSLKVEDSPHLAKLLENGQMYVNKELDTQSPLMMAPIFHKDRIAAVITIDGMNFESFSLYHQNLFQITVNLISSALSKAFTFIDATENRRYVPGTQILQQEIFQEILLSKTDIRQQHQVPYLLLNCGLNNISLHEASLFISPLLRETDYLGMNNKQQLQVLLSNTSEHDAERVLQRLSHPTITFTAVNEE
ncbi:NAD-dependent epimerase/dehydratase family protein [Paenibacillus endoradicis]|uniref:NAD-dependent epimerase/dehydratase family protein n=1 Tax=Paenibacillus endoradicis TaxID=2972487 RepID=UPI0021598085|nr:NAD-dependent epimerase/dehydratase family protein [Paenibacillus endoradicis]MCR8657591.1 GDP-mannose 4,6-dehydratase [Paenibacillus endoradicis]